MKLSNHFLTLIVPVYKQEKTIVKNLKSLKKVLEKIRYHYEIIVVIDGLVDKSFERVKKSKLKKIKLLAYEKNHGKSYAIRSGMSIAKGDYIMFIDSGMEIDPNGISMLLEHMEWYNADIIVGSKRHLASQVHYPLSRKILSHGYYLFVKLLFGLKIHDTQAGIKVFRKKVLARVLPRLVEKKFAGDLEILVVSYEQGFDRIYEAPIKLDYTISPITSAATIQSIIGILIDTCAIFYRMHVLQYYRRIHRRLTYSQNVKIVTL